jgi:hypothetical protein
MDPSQNASSLVFTGGGFKIMSPATQKRWSRAGESRLLTALLSLVRGTGTGTIGGSPWRHRSGKRAVS